jgi:hypothetical protein
VEKAFDKIKNPFFLITKTLTKKIELLQLDKGHLQKSTANIKPNGEKQSFPAKIKNKAKMSPLRDVF